MLKREIKYTDFSDPPKEVTETFYFNISKPELVELEVEYNEGFSAAIQRIINADDKKALIYEFKRIVLLAYGVRSEDGKRFVKSEELKEEFSQTAAYQELFMELATKDDAAVTFLKGVLPPDMVGELDKAATLPAISPTPPVPPPQTS